MHSKQERMDEKTRTCRKCTTCLHCTYMSSKCIIERRRMKTPWKLAIAVAFHALVCPLGFFKLFSYLLDSSGFCPLESIERIAFELDASRRYGIIRDLRLPSLEHKRRDISLLIELDAGKLRYALDLTKSWNGPIQFVVFALTDTIIDDVISTIDTIRSCFPKVLQHVHWHLAFPKLSKTRIALRENFRGSLEYRNHMKRHNCSSGAMRRTFVGLREISSALNTNPYTTSEHIHFFPSNALWNVARRACKTEFFIVIDADLLPSVGLREKFLSFARNRELFDLPGNSEDLHDPISSPPCPTKSESTSDSDETTCQLRKSKHCHGRDVYVIPTFQFSGPDTEIPQNVVTLLREYNSINRAEAFYHNVSNAYKPTNHNLWIKTMEKVITDQKENMSCLYEVTWLEHYEPFFVARNSAPFMNEYFSGSAYTKISYSTETYASGYRFKVMSNGFFVHRGRKTGFDSEKMMELGALGRFFGYFMRDIKSRYNITIGLSNRLNVDLH